MAKTASEPDAAGWAKLPHLTGGIPPLIALETGVHRKPPTQQLLGTRQPYARRLPDHLPGRAASCG
jgi:hypothetical protein